MKDESEAASATRRQETAGVTRTGPAVAVLDGRVFRPVVDTAGPGRETWGWSVHERDGGMGAVATGFSSSREAAMADCRAARGKVNTLNNRYGQGGWEVLLVGADPIGTAAGAPLEDDETGMTRLARRVANLETVVEVLVNRPSAVSPALGNVWIERLRAAGFDRLGTARDGAVDTPVEAVEPLGDGA